MTPLHQKAEKYQVNKTKIADKYQFNKTKIEDKYQVNKTKITESSKFYQLIIRVSIVMNDTKCIRTESTVCANVKNDENSLSLILWKGSFHRSGLCLVVN